MPLYEYKCSQCAGTFEVLLPRRQATSRGVECTTCGSRRTRRLMSTFVGRGGSADGSTSALGGADACAGCRRSSCAGCRSG